MLARYLQVLAVLLAIVVGLGALWYRQLQRQIAMFSQPMPAPTVSVAQVRETSWEPTLEAVGTVQAVQGVEVSNQVAGQVREILFESGASVKAGAVLVRLDDAVDRADLEGLEAAERLAQIKLGRNRALLKDRAVAQGDVDEIGALLDQIRAQIKGKQATIEKKVIRAPFDGQLGIRAVNLGQFLPEGTAVAPLQALDPVYVDYSLPERQLARLAVGQGVRLRVSAWPERTFEGSVAAIGPGIDPATRNVRVRAALENPDRALRPGMFARVSTRLPTEERVLTLPREAISFNTYGDSVFVVEEKDGKTLVARRQIDTGAVRGDEVAVRDGLKSGERVVTAGQSKLGNGQEVQIKPETPAPGSKPVLPETSPQ